MAWTSMNLAVVLTVTIAFVAVAGPFDGISGLAAVVHPGTLVVQVSILLFLLLGALFVANVTWFGFAARKR